MQNLTSKLTTLAAALVMNGLVIGGVAYLFAMQLQQPPVAVAQAHLQTQSSVLA